MPAVTPGPHSLRIILDAVASCSISAQLDKLWRYHQMLRQANATLNLTRIHNFENMVLKHYVDSLLVLEYIELPSPLIDMGSGAGLPGIPLKIARPDVPMVLAEPRGARAGFLREVCESLALKAILVYPHKLGPDYPGQAGGVISRAVGSIPETLDRVAACLAPGGRMIFMKGPGCDDELAAAASLHADHFHLAADRAYTIGGTPHRRRLVVYERTERALPGRLPGSHDSSGAEPAEPWGGTIREITSGPTPPSSGASICWPAPVSASMARQSSPARDPHRDPGAVLTARPRLADRIVGSAPTGCFDPVVPTERRPLQAARRGGDPRSAPLGRGPALHGMVRR